MEKSSDTVFFSNSEEETKKIAKNIASSLKRGDVILLSGELGAGKTAFMKGVAEFFGISDVTSPTYAYLNVYGGFLYHYDCYRLSCGEDAMMLGLTDYFGGDNICFIEWAENVSDVIPDGAKKIVIEKTAPTERRITLCNF